MIYFIAEGRQLFFVSQLETTKQRRGIMKGTFGPTGLFLLWAIICPSFHVFFLLSIEDCIAFSPIDGGKSSLLGFPAKRDGSSFADGRSSLELDTRVGLRMDAHNNTTVTAVDPMDNYIADDGNDLEAIRSLTKIAIYQCGTVEGLDALTELNELCNNRLPFDFDAHHRKEGMLSVDDGSVVRGERVISLLPGFLPPRTVDSFLESVRCMEDQGWMSTNPDSVDGLPSLHVNLVSQGKPLFDKTASRDDEEDSFQNRIFQLYDLVRPYVYETLLPKVDRLLKERQPDNSGTHSRTLRVSDVFFRRYGQDVCGNVTRNGISIHYDVFSRVTAVVALDDVASKGDNGLFTLTVNERTGETSNHKALRRFFPLKTGDCVVHTWDVLHGVDVELGLDRTSLIVWFDEVDENDDDGVHPNDETPCMSPWLSLEHQNKPANDDSTTTLENGNDVQQFVLASALSSTETKTEGSEHDETRLYLRSASRGNVFALARMGSIFEERIPLPQELETEAVALLDERRPVEKLPEIIQSLLKDIESVSTEIACRFWLEASLSGNPLAQKSLADEIMFEASQSGNADHRLLAAVLFALASQQDDNDEHGPCDALSRIIEYDLAARDVQSEDEFLASPVVQTAQAALGIV